MGFFSKLFGKKEANNGSAYEPKRHRNAKVSAEKVEITEGLIDSINKRYIAFDVETTGLNAQTDRIVEVGAVMFENGQIVSGQKGESEDTCAAYIKSHGGLASSAEDNVYGEKNEYSDKAQAYKGVDCTLTKQPNYYNDLYCKLHGWKQTKLSNAKSQYNSITKKFSTQEKNRVKERLDSINNTIKLLEFDNKEVVQITPNMKTSEIDKKLKTAKADRTAARKTDTDGIVAMDNQGQVIPYCPVYRFK